MPPFLDFTTHWTMPIIKQEAHKQFRFLKLQLVNKPITSTNICVKEIRFYIVWHPVAVMNNVDTAPPKLDQENGSLESSSGVAVPPNFLSRAVTNSDGVGPSLFSILVDETRTSARSSRASASESCSSGLCTGK